jgi:hypothetical protein
MMRVGEKHGGHVAFFTNQIKTHFYAATAARLGKPGVRVSWIATSARWANVARREAGASPDDILDLSEAGPEWTDGRAPSATNLDLLARIERAGGLSINEMISWTGSSIGARGDLAWLTPLRWPDAWIDFSKEEE